MAKDDDCGTTGSGRQQFVFVERDRRYDSTRRVELLINLRWLSTLAESWKLSRCTYSWPLMWALHNTRANWCVLINSLHICTFSRFLFLCKSYQNDYIHDGPKVPDVFSLTNSVDSRMKTLISRDFRLLDSAIINASHLKSIIGSTFSHKFSSENVPQNLLLKRYRVILGPCILILKKIIAIFSKMSTIKESKKSIELNIKSINRKLIILHIKKYK